jgi:hypothetical protein
VGEEVAEAGDDAIFVVFALAGDTEEAGGLVDDDEVRAFEDDARGEGHGGGYRCEGVRR